MNQRNRRTYSNLNKSQLNRFERLYLTKIYKALRTQITGFIDMINERGIDGAIRSLDRYLLNDKVGSVINDLYVEAGLFFARKTTREIRRSIKEKASSFGFSEEWTQAIIDFLNSDYLRNVAGITNEMKDQILLVLEKGTREGWSISRIVQELQTPELIAWRARRIARTELGKAAFAGRKIAEDTNDYETEKEWIASNDHRTRSSHRSIDGEIVDSDARFQVSRATGGVDMMEGPGDPTASIENIVNCRCSLAIHAKRDSKGKLIPKPRRVTIIQPDLSNPKRTIITI